MSPDTLPWPVDRLHGALADGTLDGMIAAAGTGDLPEIAQTAMALDDPAGTEAVLEAIWRSHPTSFAPLAAAVHVAPRLPVEDLAKWSGRLRARGLGKLCPLMARVTDPGRAGEERVAAARVAWDLYFEDAAAAALRELGADVPDPVPPYYRYARPEVVARVPLGARRVLDVGCAAGRLGFAAKNRQPATVVGIERDEVAAAAARRVLDGVVVTDLDSDDLRRAGSDFDAIVTADVLEHVQDPWGTVTRLAGLLRPGGVLVASIPNIANLGVLSQIVEGRFDYVEAGILDRTHLRFFTRATAVELMEGAGLTVESVEPIRDPFLPSVEASTGPAGVALTTGRLQVADLDPTKAEDLLSVQFLIVARKRMPLPETARPQVWDCVMFFDELEVLQARMIELDGVADHVVVVESDTDHRGEPKPLIFQENRSLFDRFAARIHHLVVTLPERASPKDREIVQRNAVLDLLTSIPPGDLVLFCDVDEIVSRDAVDIIMAATASGPVALDMALYYYALHWRSPQPWYFAKALRARDLTASLDWLRMLAVRPHSSLPVVPDTGWHLSYFGGEERVHTKLSSYSHAEYDTAEVHAAVPDLLAEGRTVHGIPLERVDDPFPDHIRERFGDPAESLPRESKATSPRPARTDPAAGISPAPRFTENWYPPGQLGELVALLRRVLEDGIEGDIVEIGCWEGRSTIELAKVTGEAGRRLHAVDWWLGNLDEGDSHPSVTALASRDVYQVFLDNMAPYPNVDVHREDGGKFLTGMAHQGTRSLAFIHLDAGHTYAATKGLIDLAIPLISPGGMLCGDDFVNSHAGRADLGGGVEQAVRDAFRGDGKNIGNLWFYRRPLSEDPRWWPPPSLAPPPS